MNTPAGRPSWTIRILAALIVIGAIWGAVGTLMVTGTANQGRVYFPLRILPLELLWIASGMIGAWLWTGAAAARRVAAIMLATQIPVVATSALTFWWYSLAQIAMKLQFADHLMLVIALEFRSAVAISFRGTAAASTFGINFLALAGLIVLLRSGRRTR
jgi:hypothetical protein